MEQLSRRFRAGGDTAWAYFALGTYKSCSSKAKKHPAGQQINMEPNKTKIQPPIYFEMSLWRIGLLSSSFFGGEGGGGAVVVLLVFDVEYSFRWSSMIFSLFGPRQQHLQSDQSGPENGGRV